MADNSEKVSQDEIEALLARGKGGASPPAAKAAPAEDVDKILGQGEIEALLSSKKMPAAAAAAPPRVSAPAAAAAAATGANAPGQIAQGDVELLLRGRAVAADRRSGL